MITYSLMEATRSPTTGLSIYKEQLKWLAKRVATNRERAGLHYPSDSLGGRFLAAEIFDTMLKINHNNLYSIFYQALQDAKAEWNVA